MRESRANTVAKVAPAKAATAKAATGKVAPTPAEPPPAAAPRAASPGCPVEEIAQAYLATTHGDAAIALRCAITDALADLLEAERRARENSRLISRGYVRDAVGLR